MRTLFADARAKQVKKQYDQKMVELSTKVNESLEAFKQYWEMKKSLSNVDFFKNTDAGDELSFLFAACSCC